VLDINPRFGTAGLVLAIPLAAYAVFGEPLLGRSFYARLKREREQDRGALLRFYRLTLSIEWAWTAVVGIIVVVAPELSGGSVGLALPGGRHLPQAFGFTGAIAVSVAVSSVILHQRAVAGKSIPGQGAVLALLPRTSAERRLAVAVSMTAGICEEVLYRGLLIALAVDLLGLSVWGAATDPCSCHFRRRSRLLGLERDARNRPARSSPGSAVRDHRQSAAPHHRPRPHRPPRPGASAVR